MWQCAQHEAACLHSGRLQTSQTAPSLHTPHLMDTMDTVLWRLKGQMSGGSLESYAAWIQTGMCVAARSCWGPRLGGGWRDGGREEGEVGRSLDQGRNQYSADTRHLHHQLNVEPSNFPLATAGGAATWGRGPMGGQDGVTWRPADQSEPGPAAGRPITSHRQPASHLLRPHQQHIHRRHLGKLTQQIFSLAFLKYFQLYTINILL